MKSILNRFFPEKNENYNKAKSSLIEIKKSFDSFVISFPDVTPNEIILIKEQWEKLPNQISKGVEVMGIKAVKEYKSIILSYKTNSYIMPHVHNNLYEYGKILKGSIKDKLTGKIYIAGEIYKFKPNQPHYLNTNGSACMVYSILTENSDFQMKPLPKKLKVSLNLA
tara:strand:- start:4350 stop:4850 length:501 start_codon:yes stop_codon:yes gene_type:complete